VNGIIAGGRGCSVCVRGEMDREEERRRGMGGGDVRGRWMGKRR